MLKRIVCAMLALMMLCASCALADTYVAAKKLKPTDELYVLDRAGVLTEDTRGEIVYSNDLLNQKCGAQIAVVTVGTTGSESIDDYTTELFNTWGVGDAKAGNGFMLLLAIDDDDYYAVCGDGLQPKLTSGTLKDYFDRYLETDFAAKRYDAGVKKFFEAIFARVADTYNADVTVEQGIAAYRASGSVALPGAAQFGGGGSYAQGRQPVDDGDGFGLVLGVLIVIVMIVLLARLSRRRRVARSVFVAPPPPPPPTVGQGGYRGVTNQPGAGGYRGPTQTPVQTSRQGSDDEWLMRGLMRGMFRSTGGGFRSSGGYRSSSSSRSSSSRSSSFRSSGGSSRSFGGGRSSGGGAGRGRH